MTVLRLLVAYDGSDLHGFAAQPGLRTVEGILAAALAELAGEPVRVAGAGRTDAGVHALGQVVSVDGWRGPGPEEVLRALAGRLPRDVGVLDAALGPQGFHARRSALWRSYTYLVWNADTPHPLLARYTTWVRQPVDEELLDRALRTLVGTHDFRSFARVREGQWPVRTVYEAGAEREGCLVRVRVTADAFLHQMVRSIVGSALEVAAGAPPRRRPGWMREVLLARDRSAAGRVAPPQGLALVDVGYEGAPWRRRGPVPWPWAGHPGRESWRLSAGGLR